MHTIDWRDLKKNKKLNEKVWPLEMVYPSSVKLTSVLLEDMQPMEFSRKKKMWGPAEKNGQKLTVKAEFVRMIQAQW